MPATRSSTGPAAPSHGEHVTEAEPRRCARVRGQDHRAACVEGLEGGGPVPGSERETAVGGEVRAADGRRLEARARRRRGRSWRAVSRGRRPAWRRAARPRRRRRSGAGAIAVRISSPGTTSASQRRGGDAGVRGDGAEGDDHREADDERADRERRPGAVARERGTRQPLLEPQPEPERQAGHVSQRAEQRRRHEDAEQQEGVDRDRERQPHRRGGRDGQQEHRERADGDDHDDQPANPCARTGRRIRAGTQGGDRADRGGPAGRLERGDHRHQDPDGQARQQDRRRDLGARRG